MYMYAHKSVPLGWYMDTNDASASGGWSTNSIALALLDGHTYVRTLRLTPTVRVLQML